MCHLCTFVLWLRYLAVVPDGYYTVGHKAYVTNNYHYMKFLIFCAAVFLTTAAFAQSDSTFASTDVTVDVSSVNFAASRGKLNSFILSNRVKVQKQIENVKSVTVTMSLNDSQYLQFDQLLGSLGYVLSKEVNTANSESEIRSANLELEFLKGKCASYSQLLSKVDSSSESYMTLWGEQKAVEEKIYESSKALLELTSKSVGYSVTIFLKDEITTPDQTKVAFVNMPGFEYSYLSIESPKKGVSYSSYQGYFLKYLFTRGKSYAYTGAYKSVGASKDDSTAYSEMFVLGFGQDFYSRHFGRGDRKFLNLYSGYTVGYVYATGKTTKTNFYYIAPSIGVELLKTKHVLIDTKATYFIPFSNNKNLRGIGINASFNFVF